VGEEYLDKQGLEPMGLEGEAVRGYMAQLEEAVRISWKTTGPADNLPDHYGRLVEPEGPKSGERWPTDNYLAFQVQTLWVLERAVRTFGEGCVVSFAGVARRPNAQAAGAEDPPVTGRQLQIVSELPHLQPEEMREMEMVLRSCWQLSASGQRAGAVQGPTPRVPLGNRVPSGGDCGADL
jgi:hypothetical protein